MKAPCARGGRGTARAPELTDGARWNRVRLGTRVLLGLWVGLGISALLAEERGSGLSHALNSIVVPDLSRHADYLASDDLEGREAGAKGGHLAGDYLVAELKRLGFAGAAEDGVYTQSFPPNFRNVLGLLEGRDPKLKQQVVVLAAHYDHVGYGNRRNSLGPIGYIHNGADDNASGTSGVLEVAEALTLLPSPPKRSVLIAFWDAEEKGLLGSKHWTAHPTLPLQRVVLAIDVDMIGRLRQDRILVFGSRGGYGLRSFISQQNRETGLSLEFSWLMKGNGDHFSFFQQEIPSLLFSTGEHEDYHRPSDKPQRLVHDGMQRVARLLFQVLYEAAEQDATFAFRPAARNESPEVERALWQQQPRLADRLGASVQDVRWSASPVVTQVVPGSPADRAGLRLGDRIGQWAGRPIHRSSELAGLLPMSAASVQMHVFRSGMGEALPLQVELEGKPMRLGITWRSDDAEPGSIVLTHVVPDSPAARAGLAIGDRVLQVGGQPLKDDKDFSTRVQALPDSGELLIERGGILLRLVVPFDADPARQAA